MCCGGWGFLDQRKKEKENGGDDDDDDDDDDEDAAVDDDAADDNAYADVSMKRKINLRPCSWAPFLLVVN